MVLPLWTLFLAPRHIMQQDTRARTAMKAFKPYLCPLTISCMESSISKKDGAVGKRLAGQEGGSPSIYYIHGALHWFRCKVFYVDTL